MSQSESMGLRTRSTDVHGQEKMDVPALVENKFTRPPSFSSGQALDGLDDVLLHGEGDLHYSVYQRKLYPLPETLSQIHSEKCLPAIRASLSLVKLTGKNNYHMRVYPFVLLPIIPWYGCTTACLTIYPLKII